MNREEAATIIKAIGKHAIETHLTDPGDIVDATVMAVEALVPKPDEVTGLVPVVRGEWIVDECDTSDDVPSYSWIDFHCSECNTNYGLEEGQYSWCRYEKIPYNYCPNCGAKMEDKHGH